jgi:hypothetical protein
MIATVTVGDIRLRPGGDPLSRSVELAGYPWDDDLFGIVEDFASEPATHVGGDHAQLVLGDPEGECPEEEPDGVRVLTRGPYGHRLVEPVPLGHACARLHGIGDQTLIDNLQLDDVVGLRQCRVSSFLVAEGPVKARVGVHTVVDHRPIAGGLPGVDDRGKWLVVDIDQVEGILCDVGRLGHHYGDLVSHVAGPSRGRPGDGWAARYRVESSRRGVCRTPRS